MEVLGISKESVYRRIRGEIAFSIEELVKLSSELQLSFDEIIGKSNETRIMFDLSPDLLENPSRSFVKAILEREICCCDWDHVDSLIASSRIPFIFMSQFDSLVKFIYYRWMHLNSEHSLNYYFSDITLPQEVEDMRAKFAKCPEKHIKISYILDSNVFLSFLNEVIYYYRRKLIKPEELAQIKEDLLKMIEVVEKVVQTGKFTDTAKIYIYLSSIKIETNSNYIHYGRHATSYFYIYAMEPIVIKNPNICALHKKQLESTKKYATLITLSNEILQARYFNAQREYVENMENMAVNLSI
ncbi:MAG: hypothetical protein LBR64_00840 [Dysgonamonadaceae bacterium]|jgi:hypothetical protein|nr:hypothetical protein [Dysgonamonadaceae bacterium]